MGACTSSRPQVRGQISPEAVQYSRSLTKDTLFTFDIDTISISEEPPKLITPEEAVKAKIPNLTHMADFSHKLKTTSCIAQSSLQGFIAAVHLAYSNHYHLRVSVSDLILLISQGLSHHLKKHANLIKREFIPGNEEEPIVINKEFPKGKSNNWYEVFDDLTKQIEDRVKHETQELAYDNTSVSTKSTRLASQIVYFDEMEKACGKESTLDFGIPKITLKGSKSDWEKLKQKVHKMKELNELDKLMLDWWLKFLIPIVESICDQAINKKADIDFWRKFYRMEESENEQFVQGWITVFFPYIVAVCGIHANDSVDWEAILGEKTYGMTLAEIPNGISAVPFVWKNPKKSTNMTLFAGFLGAKMNSGVIEAEHFWVVGSNEELDT